MSPAFDPIVRLAVALNASRGAYAVLLGSGISVAAGVPTGRQIVADLIARVAALEGVPVGNDPFGWYRHRFSEEPDYSRLLAALASSPTERSELLKRYFEVSANRRLPGPHAPSAAHRALAQLAARGYISVFLTTNFDRLLERALEAAGIAPAVLSTPDSLEGSVPLGRARCTLVKLNGDYLDTRIKNTPDELGAYHPAVDKLLDRVLDEYGLIVCGWSADWDTALRNAFERTPTRRYTTFWASRTPPTGLAAHIVERRGAEVILIKDADTLFTDLAARLAALEGGAGTATGRTASRLPVSPAAFVGRRKELKEIGERLKNRAVRLLTLVGPGGTGKTALALQAAAKAAAIFADGVIFVDLSSARTTDAALVAIARTVGLTEDMARPLPEAIVDHLRDRHLLLVLDNFEQVIEAAGFVAQLLAGCPEVSVLVTSRQALQVRGEHLYPVQPLSVPPADVAISGRQLQRYEAVQLFVDRARAVRPDFRLTDSNAAVVSDICRRLDGLPLAIELAAARLRLFSPVALRDQLGERLKHLRDGARDLPERQRTLRTTVDWSYQLLQPEERHLFELLSVFAGADIAAVEAVAAQADPGEGGVADVLNGLTSLVEKSLIQRVDVAHGGLRIALLETIREFATDRLAQHPNLAARARRAHASYYADLVHRLQPNMTGNQRLEVLAAMAADIDNLHLAWTYWVNAEALQQLEKMADALLMLNESRGWYSATVSLTTDMLAVLERCSPSQVDQEIGLRTTLARALMATRGYTPEVEDAFARSIELFDRGGDVHQHFSALRGQACLLSMRGNLRDGMRMGLELQRFAERENDPAMLIEGNLRLGVLKTMVNDPQGGLDHLDRAISLFPAVPRHAFTTRAGGNDPRVACYTTAALALWLLGYPDQAVARANAALTLAKELDYPFTQANAYFHSGLLHLWRRDFDIVLTRAVDLQSIAGRHGFQIWTATATILSGAAQVGLGSGGGGLANLQSGMDLYQGMHSPPVFWPMLLSIQATACLDAGRPGEGLRLIKPALDIMSAGAGATLLCELQLLKGDLLAAVAAEHGRNDPEADRWHQMAFDRARELKLRTTQLRAAIRLCRAAKDNAGQNAAITGLAEIHAIFTEGGTAPDVIEARALLAACTAPSADA